MIYGWQSQVPWPSLKGHSFPTNLSPRRQHWHCHRLGALWAQSWMIPFRCMQMPSLWQFETWIPLINGSGHISMCTYMQKLQQWLMTQPCSLRQSIISWWCGPIPMTHSLLSKTLLVGQIQQLPPMQPRHRSMCQFPTHGLHLDSGSWQWCDGKERLCRRMSMCFGNVGRRDYIWVPNLEQLQMLAWDAADMHLRFPRVVREKRKRTSAFTPDSVFCDVRFSVSDFMFCEVILSCPFSALFILMVWWSYFFL